MQVEKQEMLIHYLPQWGKGQYTCSKCKNHQVQPDANYTVAMDLGNGEALALPKVRYAATSNAAAVTCPECRRLYRLGLEVFDHAAWYKDPMFYASITAGLAAIVILTGLLNLLKYLMIG